MAMHLSRIKCTVAALLLTSALGGTLSAQQTDLEALFQELIEADVATHARIANRILARFEKSGSASMDLLLRRGSDAMEEGEYNIAIEHFTALLDHAPDFAEGYIMEELGRDASAKGAYEAILEIYPLDPQALEALDRIELKTQGQAI